MDPSSPRTISIVNRSGRRAPSSLIRRALSTVFEQHDAPPGEVSVLLGTDDEVRRLNREYRGLDEPTDVLTFLAGHPMLLGDIAISVPYAERQASKRRVSLSQEIGYLAIHGGLHLLGFDDKTEKERARMVAEMNRAAVAAGLRPDSEWASLLHGESQ